VARSMGCGDQLRGCMEGAGEHGGVKSESGNLGTDNSMLLQG
jgi:hypothetical protein